MRLRLRLNYLTLTLVCFSAAPGALSGQVPEGRRDIILATTTSFRDTGLLDSLLPIFEHETGYRVRTIAVGSGQALKLGERGDADVVLAHSPAAEQEFMGRGFGASRAVVARSTRNVRRSRLLIPRTFAPQPSARSSPRGP